MLFVCPEQTPEETEYQGASQTMLKEQHPHSGPSPPNQPVYIIILLFIAEWRHYRTRMDTKQ